MRFVPSERQPVLRHPVVRASSAPSQHALRTGERLGPPQLERGAGHVTRGPKISASACHRSLAAPTRGPSWPGGRASEGDGWPAGAGSSAVPRPQAGNARPLSPSVEAQRLRAGAGRAGVRSDVPEESGRPASDAELQDHGACARPSAMAARRRSGGRAREEQAALSAPSAAEPCQLASAASAAVPRSGELSGRRGEAPPPSTAAGHVRLLAAEQTAADRRAPSRRPSAAFPEPAAERWC